jgi:hypothetical protein
MINSEPPDRVPLDCSWKAINTVDYGAYFQTRPGSRYVFDLGASEINGWLDHQASNVVVAILDTTVCVFAKTDEAVLQTGVAVANLTPGTTPTGVCAIVAIGKNAVLASSAGLFWIALDEAYYYMFRMNSALPSTLITDVNESGTKTYGYWYIYSAMRIKGAGNRDRTGTDEVQWESGTCQVAGQDKDYGEVFFEHPVGVSLANNHVLGALTLPDGATHATHFGVYRTKNIGKLSGGVSSYVDGIGNQYDQVIWTCDVPVAKAFRYTVSGNTITLQGGTNAFTCEDVGNTITDTAGRSGVIDGYVSATTATLTAGHTFPTGTMLNGAYGGGRVMECSQNGTTITRTAGASFVAGDVGLMLFRSDGSYATVKSYTDANHVEAEESASWGPLACTMKPASGNFTRVVNDVTPDSQTAGRVDLNSRMHFDLYIPRRYMKPIPNGNMVVVTGGFIAVMERDGTRYYYSNIGDKDFCGGYYRTPDQTREINGPARLMIPISGGFAIICTNMTYTVQAGASQNVGRAESGEVVMVLPEPMLAHPTIGVQHWQSMVVIRSGADNANVWFGLTNEPAFRMFDGYNWSKEDYAVDQRTGLKAIVDEVLAIDPYYQVVAGYSPQGGYLLWYFRRIDSNDPDVSTDYIQDIGGDSVEEDCMIQDIGDVVDESVQIQDIGGTI